jgi:hypothetical protein
MKIKLSSLLFVALATASVLGKVHNHALGFFQG